MESHAEVLRQILADVKAVQAHLQGHVEPRLLTLEQAGTYLGRTRRSIEYLISVNAFATVRYGDRVHIDRRDLDEWIKKNRF